jgi:hypothetical protein
MLFHFKQLYVALKIFKIIFITTFPRFFSPKKYSPNIYLFIYKNQHVAFNNHNHVVTTCHSYIFKIVHMHIFMGTHTHTYLCSYVFAQVWTYNFS